ncbi:MAG TPA: YMGG-like glycine zipper-containing protein, partial [Lacipirellulaceae bacterium]|nr:YMGG-like glycine zipper-containing protein [Lacipirellulaceae bacterium]
IKGHFALNRDAYIGLINRHPEETREVAMRSFTFVKTYQIKFLLAMLAATFGLASMQPAMGQPYYYQPAPDYYHNDTASGTFLGGVMGAITGAVIGGRHHSGQDALIGAGVGAVTGNLLGRSKDAADDRRAAAGQVAVNQMNAQAAAMAVTEADLVQMTRAGISDDVIVSTMRSRGTRVDLSPQALISLRQQGVSDRVILAAQQIGAAPGYYGAPAPAGTTVVTEVPPPPSVIVAPVYRPYWWYHPYYYHHYYHPHTVVRVGF